MVAAVTLSVMVEERGGKEERDISQGEKEVGE